MREAHMLDSGEGQLLGHFTEELRSSFRSAYAIFGKVALFLNDYFSVGLQEGAVSLSRLWREHPKKPGVRPIFKGRENWPLRGLYFLSRDLVDDEFSGAAEPDASNLADLRVRLEHRFVSLHHAACDGTSDMHASVSLSLFEHKTLRMLKLAREALIYLSLAVHGRNCQVIRGHPGTATCGQYSSPGRSDRFSDQGQDEVRGSRFFGQVAKVYSKGKRRHRNGSEETSIFI